MKRRHLLVNILVVLAVVGLVTSASRQCPPNCETTTNDDKMNDVEKIRFLFAQNQALLGNLKSGDSDGS